MEPEPNLATEFDDEQSVLLKNAIRRGVPVSYLVIDPASPETREDVDYATASFVSILDVVDDTIASRSAERESADGTDDEDEEEENDGEDDEEDDEEGRSDENEDVDEQERADEDGSGPIGLEEIAEDLLALQGKFLAPSLGDQIPLIVVERWVARSSRSGQSSSPVDYQAVIKETNAFLRKIGKSEIVSKKDLDDQIGEMKRSRAKKLKEEKSILERITSYQDELMKFPEYQASSIQVTRVVLHLKMVPTSDGDYMGRPVGPEVGIDVFDRIRLSDQVPFAQYNKATYYTKKAKAGKRGDERVRPNRTVVDLQKFFKVYGEPDREAFDPAANMALVTLDKPDVIYLSVLMEDGDGSKKPASRDSYRKAVLYLDRSVLEIQVDVYGEDSIARNVEKIESHLGLKVAEVEEKRVAGEFSLYGVDFEELSFHHVLLLNEMFRRYLYVDETSDASVDKQRTTLHFRSIVNATDDEGRQVSAASANVLQLRLENDEEMPTDDGRSVFLKKDDAAIRVSIGRAQSRRAAETFKKVLNRLLSYYNNAVVEERDDGSEETYRDYVVGKYERLLGPPPDDSVAEQSSPETTPVKTPSPKKRSGRKTAKTSKLIALQSQFPHIFPTKYAKQCQQTRQPHALRLDDDQTRQFEARGYRAVPFPPPPHAEMLFVCDDDPNYSYPGVIVNAGDNAANYPYLPCCFGQDQTGKRSNYNRYYSNDKSIKAKEGGHVMTSEKVLTHNRFGHVAKTIHEMMETLANSPGASGRFLKQGVQLSPNSLIHCVLTATADPAYARLDTDDAREKHAIAYRKRLRDLRLELLSQEMYDYDDAERLQRLADTGSFFDSALFYRLLEERENVNLFVLESANDEVRFETPRHQFYHARTVRPDRPAVLFYRNVGLAADNLRFPHYELIVDTTAGLGRKKGMQALFRPVVNEKLYHFFFGTRSVVTWRMEDSLVVHENPSSDAQYFKDVATIFPEATIREQVIDGAGKTRGFYLEVPKASAVGKKSVSKGGTKSGGTKGRAKSPGKEAAGESDRTDGTDVTPIICLFYPTQPENLPRYRLRQKVIDRISYDEVVGALKTRLRRTAVTGTKGYVTGIWFELYPNHPYSLYVPFKAERRDARFEGLPDGLPGDTFLLRSSVPGQDRDGKLRRDVKILLNLTLWVLTVYLKHSLKKSRVETVDLDPFFEKHVQVGDADGNAGGDVEDSAGVYDFSDVSRLLPATTSVRQAFAHLRREAPSLVGDGNTLFLYSEKLATGVRYFLEQYLKTHAGLPSAVMEGIPNFYVSSFDFSKQRHVDVFVGESEFNQWTKNKASAALRTNEIKLKIDASYASYERPYVYLSAQDSRYYLVQNVRGGDARRAIAVGVSWASLATDGVNPRFVNPGFDADPVDEDSVPPYRVFKVGANSHIVLEQDADLKEGEQAVDILFYDIETGDRAAALLPLPTPEPREEP